MGGTYFALFCSWWIRSVKSTKLEKGADKSVDYESKVKMMVPESYIQGACTSTQLSDWLMYSNVVPLTDFNVADVKKSWQDIETNVEQVKGIDKDC